MPFPVSQGSQGCTSRDSSRYFISPLCGRTLDECIFVVVKSQSDYLIDNLVVATNRLIKGLPTAPISSPSSSVQQARPRIFPVYLVWSAALRACPDVTIEASIEYVGPLSNIIIFIYWVPRVGRSRKYIHLAKSSQFLRDYVHLGYRRNLQSSHDFADQTLENCVNVLHVDIVEIWNLNAGDNVSYLRFPCFLFYLPSHGHQYLLSTSFKMKMSHVVKDLAEILAVC